MSPSEIDESRSKLLQICASIINRTTDWAVLDSQLGTLNSEWRPFVVRSLVGELLTTMKLLEGGLSVLPYIADSFRSVLRSPVSGFRGQLADRAGAEIYAHLAGDPLAVPSGDPIKLPVVPKNIEALIDWSTETVIVTLQFFSDLVATVRVDQIALTRAACLATMQGNDLGALSCLRWLSMISNCDELPVWTQELVRYQITHGCSAQITFHIAIFEHAVKCNPPQR